MTTSKPTTTVNGTHIKTRHYYVLSVDGTSPADEMDDYTTDDFIGDQ